MRVTSKELARREYTKMFGTPVPVASWTEEKIRHCIRMGTPKVTMTAKSLAAGKFQEAAGVAPAKSWTAAKIEQKLADGDLKAPKAAPSKAGSGMTMVELRKQASERQIAGRSKMNKAQLIAAIEADMSKNRKVA